MTKPLFTTVVTVFDNPQYFSECIKSILLNDFTDYELIIIDDCLNLDCRNIATEYAFDSRIRYIKNPSHYGVNKSRLVGLEAAKGDYITFINATDYVAPSFLNKSAAAFKEGNCDSTFHRTIVVEGDQTNNFTKNIYYYQFAARPNGQFMMYDEAFYHYPSDIFGKVFKTSMLTEFKDCFTSEMNLDLEIYYKYMSKYPYTSVVLAGYYVVRLLNNSYSMNLSNIYGNPKMDFVSRMTRVYYYLIDQKKVEQYAYSITRSIYKFRSSLNQNNMSVLQLLFNNCNNFVELSQSKYYPNILAILNTTLPPPETFSKS